MVLMEQGKKRPKQLLKQFSNSISIRQGFKNYVGINRIFIRSYFQLSALAFFYGECILASFL